MSAEQVLKFKILFEQERQNLLYTQSLIQEEFNLQADDLPDTVDLATSELETSMRMRLRNREALYLKKISEALRRISEGTFGQCAICEEEIEPGRLEARPTASCCLACKEEQEQKEHGHVDGRKSKSLGTKVRLSS